MKSFEIIRKIFIVILQTIMKDINKSKRDGIFEQIALNNNKKHLIYSTIMKRYKKKSKINKFQTQTDLLNTFTSLFTNHNLNNELVTIVF